MHLWKPKFFLSVLILCIFHMSIKSQPGISQIPDLPDCRTSALLIYHPKTKALLLFDGYQIHLDSNKSDVWKWDGRRWGWIPAAGPGSRSLSAGSLNLQTGSIQMFGGIGKGGYETGKKDDSWIFDGDDWKDAKLTKIGSRDHHKMVYDDKLHSFVLYGGLDANREYDTTTWIIQGNNIIPLKIASPGPRYHFGMAYDKLRKKVVLYGGGNKLTRDEVWEFDGKKWEKITVKGVSPGGRTWHNLVYSDLLKMIVMHGGNETTQGWTWGWSGREWKKIAEDGPVGNLQALGYDPHRKAIVAYGGSHDNIIYSHLWELKDGKWKKLIDNGRWKYIDNQLVKMAD